MQTTTRLQEREIWGVGSFTRVDPKCTPITLPAAGVLTFASDNVVTLTSNIVFQPLCTSITNHTLNAPISPFYASSTPQVYVVAITTALAWILVIMLIISPRTFVSNLSSGPGKGIIGGANGGRASAVGVGSRPWLQKAAALTVAVSLTIATADTFIVSESHYPGGIDGNMMRTLVENSLKIRITRLGSDIFVWLAQVQTLIRLFPRHKEKVIIKWIGLVLIVLDTTFAALNSFLVNTSRRPRDFVDAIPALCYLFELSLSLLYAAWVIYYAFTKRRYAFYHPKMKSNLLIACLSLVSILTPVVFFVTDITLVQVAGWGDYFRWVGAAAASVVVWEWVERIEILERDEKKDGILGREIYDGDEMVDTRPGGEMTYNAQRNDSYVPRRRSGSDMAFPSALERAPRSHSSTDSKELALYSSRESGSGVFDTRSVSRQTQLSPPPQTPVCPPSRTDTTSAASTIYVVRHDGNPDIQPVRHRLMTPDRAASRVLETPMEDDLADDIPEILQHERGLGRYGVTNPFKRKRTSPPAEEEAVATGNGLFADMRPIRTLRQKFGGVTSRNHHRSQEKPNSDVELPWTVIPAQARGTAWTPNSAIDRESRSPSSTTLGGTQASSSAGDRPIEPGQVHAATGARPPLALPPSSPGTINSKIALATAGDGILARTNLKSNLLNFCKLARSLGGLQQTCSLLLPTGRTCRAVTTRLTPHEPLGMGRDMQ
ncbi:hypothetical protein ANO11243_033520 [Dothideomycetidae sp. 11243]|nr:hypothetical protein ANO11243_033520 [fungal sp. No.11243]